MRANFFRIVEAAATTHERFEVTRNGSRVAVLLGADDYDGLVETVAILSDGDLVADIRAGLADLAAGRTSSPDELRADSESSCATRSVPCSRRGAASIG